MSDYDEKRLELKAQIRHARSEARGLREAGGTPVNFYLGVRVFKGYMNRVFGRAHHPYDWADLNEAEKARYAERERTRRERRTEKR